jgi:hypothetical protein
MEEEVISNLEIMSSRLVFESVRLMCLVRRDDLLLKARERSYGKPTTLVSQWPRMGLGKPSVRPFEIVLDFRTTRIWVAVATGRPEAPPCTRAQSC